MIQAHIFYSGTVQGVGFRFTVNRYAAFNRLCGWVKNLPDGRVEVLVEGSQDSIEKFMQDVESHFRQHIQNKEINYAKPEGKFKDFRIIH